MSKKFLRAFAIATTFIAGVSGINYISPTLVAEASKSVANYTYSEQVTQYLKELNAVRKASGAPELAIDSLLSKSAQNHAEYLNTHGHSLGIGHTQDKSKSGFTGESSRDRFIAVGGSMKSHDTLSEAVASSGNGLKTAFEGLLESIGHRSILLSKYDDTVGIGISGNIIVIVTKNNETKESVDYTSVKYPYDGQINVDTAYDLANVSSSILKEYGVSKAGYVISFAPYDSKYGSTYNIELYDSKNTRVQTLNPANKADGHGMFFYIIPKAELKKGEKYTAKATWVDNDGNSQSETWSFITAEKTTTNQITSIIPTNPTKPSVENIDVSKFADYKADQYWAEDFQWAVNRGIINGYKNVKNPTTGKYENLLKPYANLTENQMLSILLRYFIHDELVSTQPETSWFADVNYRMATKYNLPVLGDNTEAKRAYVNKDITRGNFARILASVHFGRTVSQTEAIEFLNEHGLTTAATDKEFMATSSLTRAHAVAFFHRYEQTFNN